MREAFRRCRKFFSAFSGFRNRSRHEKAAYDPISLIPPGYCPHYGQKSGFPDSYRRILPLTTGRNPVSLIPAVGFCLSLRVKMAELYFLPYKTTKIYGTGTEISFLAVVSSQSLRVSMPFF